MGIHSFHRFIHSRRPGVGRIERAVNTPDGSTTVDNTARIPRRDRRFQRNFSEFLTRASRRAASPVWEISQPIRPADHRPGLSGRRRWRGSAALSLSKKVLVSHPLFAQFSRRFAKGL
jgi:hypothetical protein